MKEISLQDLLHMADAAAHDGIGDLWNQKTIHYLVVFTSPDEDFELIGVGPSLSCTSLDAATTHSIPGKSPEFYVKCPAAVTGRLQPKLAPTSLGANPGTARVIPVPAAPAPSLKGRTVVPFTPRPAIQLRTPASAGAPVASAATNAATATAPAPNLASLEAREQRLAELEGAERRIARRLADLDQREQDLADLGKSLKVRETALKEREAIVAAGEARLLERVSKPLAK